LGCHVDDNRANRVSGQTVAGNAADASLCMPLGAQVGQKSGTAVLRQTDRLRAMRLIDSWEVFVGECIGDNALTDTLWKIAGLNPV
jgi:hypothetical protein